MRTAICCLFLFLYASWNFRSSECEKGSSAKVVSRKKSCVFVIPGRADKKVGQNLF